MNIPNVSSTQLRRAAAIKDQIEKLERELTGILGTAAPAAATQGKPKRKMSAAARKRIAAAAHARWAKVRERKAAATPPEKGKGKMSAAAKAKLSARMKKIWARRKAAANK
jgi:hypothetical protein